jgi:hypothetical protein
VLHKLLAVVVRVAVGEEVRGVRANAVELRCGIFHVAECTGFVGEVRVYIQRSIGQVQTAIADEADGNGLVLGGGECGEAKGDGGDEGADVHMGF